MGSKQGSCLCNGKTLRPKKLIIAAGSYAINGDYPRDCPPPHYLKLAWSCERYNTLPEVGGLRDQLAGDIERMNIASNIYNAVLSWKNMFYGGGDMERWLNQHKSDWLIYNEWLRLKNES